MRILVALLLASQAPPTRTVHMVAERFSFIPSQVKVRRGEVVEFRIRSDDTNHGFRIPAAGIDAVIPKRGGGDLRVLYRADRPGRFPFECSKPCGAGHTMMRGLIIVE